MSSNTQDTLRFIFQIEKKGDVAWINQFANSFQQALTKGTQASNQFATSTQSSFTKVQSNAAKTVTIFDSFGNKVTAALKGATTSISQLSGMSGALSGLGANLQGFSRSLADVTSFSKSAVQSLGQFDTTIRRNNTSLNQGSANATRYSAIFKTIDASLKSTTASLNQNTSAIAANTAKLQQHDQVSRNAIAGSRQYQSALMAENSALATNVKAHNDASTARERTNQTIISQARGASTMVLSFAMLNSAMTDYRINQESMADINQKVTDAQDRLNAALARFGEGSFQAEQAASALEKAERGLRFELREQQNQLNNMLFLYILIGQEIVSNAVPALLNLGNTITRVRTGWATFSSTLAGIPAVFGAFARGADRSADAVSRLEKTVTPTNRGISILSSGFYTGSGSADRFSNAITKAENAGNKFRSGLSKLSGFIGGAGGGAIGAGLIAAGVGLALYSANTNGARDAVNEFGVSIGSLHPVLKGIGDGLVGVAGSLGLTGETATQTKGHFEDMNKAFDDAGAGWHAMVQGMLEDGNAFIQMAGMMAQAVGMLANPQDIIPETGGGKEDMTNTDDWLRGKTGTGANDNVSPSDLVGLEFDENGKPVFKQLITDEPLSEEALANQAKWNGLMQQSQDLLDGFYSKAQENTPEYIEAEKENVYWQEQVKQRYADLLVTGSQYDQVLQTLGKRKALETVGYQTANVEMKESALNLIELSGRLTGYEAALDTVGYQNNLMTEGVQKQREAFIGEQQEVFRLQGTFAMLGEQIASQNALGIAYTTGVLQGNIALLQRQKAIETTRGGLDALNNALVAGTAQQLAYDEGANKQRETLLKNVEAASFAQGAYSELFGELQRGEAQAAAFNKGFEESRLAILQNTVAIEQSMGAFNGWVSLVQTGKVQSNAFVQGLVSQNEELAKNYEAVFQSLGALTQYNAQLETGLPQGVAYAQTIIDMNRAVSEQEVELAAATASLQFHQEAAGEASKEITDAMVDLNTTMTQSTVGFDQFGTKTALAFTRGRDSVYEWRDSLIEAQHAEVGAHMEAAALAKAMGVQIPAGFKGGSAEILNFIAIAKRIPSAIAPIRDELKSIFDNMIGGLADALNEGQDELDDAVDELSENLKIKFNDGVEEALEFHAGTDLFEKASKELGSLFVGIGANLNAEDFGDLKENITGRLGDILDSVKDDADGTIGPKVEGIMQNIIGVFNKYTAEDMKEPMAVTNFMGELSENLIKLQSETNNFGASWDAMSTAIAAGDLEAANQVLKDIQMNAVAFSEVKFDPVTGSLVEVTRAAEQVRMDIQEIADQYGESVDQILQKANALKNIGFAAMNSLQGSESDPTSMSNMVGMNDEDKKQLQGIGLPSGEGEDGTQATIDSTIASLDQLKAKVDEVMAQVQAAVGTGMASAFAGFSQYTALMVSDFGTKIGQMINVATAGFTAIGTAAGAIGEPLATAFGTMQAAFGTIMGQMINTATAGFTAIGGAARQVAVQVTTHYNTAHGNAQGVLAMMEEDATTSFQAQGDAAVAVAEGVDTHFGKAADDGIALMDALERSVVANFEAMADAAGDVADAIDKIGQSADTAKGKVDSLKNAVEALPDIERTITYRIRTVGSAPAGAGAGLRVGAMGIPLMMNMASGGAVNIRDGEFRTVTTGESGDEFVRVFDQYGTMKEQVVRDIKSFTLKAGEAIQVQPLEGFYAKRFRNKFGDIFTDASFGNIINMAQGGEIAGNNPNNVPIYEGEPSGEWAYNANAKVTMEDGSKVRLLDWNNQEEDVRKQRMNDITAVPENYALYEDGRINRPPNWGNPNNNSENEENNPNNNNTGGNHPPGSFGGAVIGDSKTLGAGGDGYYQTVTGYNVPDYVNTAGHGSTNPNTWSNPNMNPQTWRAEEMTTKPGLWKVVDDKGVHIATEFKSKDQADEFIQEHLYHYNPTGVPPTSGGNNNNNNTNTGAGRFDDYDSSTLQTSGSGSRWQGADTSNPNGWKVVPMVDDPSKFKVVDANDKNIAVGFTTKDAAQGYIEDKKAGKGYNDKSSPDYISPTTGNNNGGNNQNNNQNGPGNNINNQNQGPQNNSGTAGNTNQSVAYDPYNRNLTAGQWGKSYLGNNRWFDPIYKNGMGNPFDPDGDGIQEGSGEDTTGGTGGNGSSGGPTQVVQSADGRVKITQGNGQQTIIIDGRQILPFGDALDSFGDSVNDFNNGVNQQQQQYDLLPNSNGTQNPPATTTGTNGLNGTNNVNIQTDSNPNSNLNGVSNVTNTANPSGVSQTQSQTGSGKFYQSQNGKVNTNMTPEEIAQWNARFPWLNLDPNAGAGGPGTGTGGNISGRIIRRNLGQLNMTGIAGSTPQSVYNNMDAKNDPTGWFNYPLLGDPILKEIPTRSLLPSGVNLGNGGGGNNGGGGGNIPDMMNTFKQMIMQMIREAFGQPINVNIGDEEIINIVRGGIMNGYSNYK